MASHRWWIVWVVAAAVAWAQTEQPPSPDPEAEPPKASAEPEAERLPQPPSVPPAFSFGATVGTEIIDGVSYMALGLQPELVLGKFGVGLDVTLRLDSSFRPYRPDWDHWTDIVAKINYLRWGRKRDPLFVKVGLLDEVYLGHGSLFYRYSNKVFLPAVRRIGLQFDVDLKAVGWELFADDILDLRILGGRFYARPFHASRMFLLNRLAFGLSGAADIRLPASAPAREVVLAGADVELPVLELPGILELLLFTDVVKNFHFPGLEGTGLIPGFTLGLFGFQFEGEYRFYQPRFGGPYFDAFYDLERETKLAAVAALTNRREGWSVRMAREIFGWVAFRFDLSGERGRNPGLHFEAALLRKVLDKVQATVSYDKRDIDSFADAFRADDIDSRLAVSVAYAVSPAVELRARYERAFKPGPPAEPVVNVAVETGLKF